MPVESTAQPNSGAEPAWRTLAELTLPAVAGSAESAVTQVAAAVKDLNLTLTRLEQLTGAVSEALRNALVQGHRFQPELPVQLNVYVSAQHDHLAACCWGFFLIEKTNTVELFLYQESA